MIPVSLLVDVSLPYELRYVLPPLGLEKLRQLVALRAGRQVAQASGNLDDGRERGS